MNVFLYPKVYPLDTLALIMKDVGLRIRVQRDLRAQFVEACRLQDKPAAQVLREFMRKYVEEHAATASQDTRRPSPTVQRKRAEL